MLPARMIYHRPVRTEPLDPERLRQEQQLLLDYARLAVTEENVALLAQQFETVFVCIQGKGT